MKVLQILPELNSGGVERGTLEVGKFLVEQGHESCVISAGGGLVKDLEAQGSRHITLPVHRKHPASFLTIPRLRNTILSEAPDIIHLRSRVPAWLTTMALKSIPAASRPHLVSTVHGFYSVNSYSRIMTCGEQVICVSNSVKNYVLRNYPSCSPDKLTVIHRGVDPAIYTRQWAPTSEWLAQWKADHPHLAEKYLILLPGRITRWKGHMDFIHIIKEIRKSIPHAHGLIAGSPHPRKMGFMAELESEITSRQLDGHITRLGHRTDMQEVMATSDVTLTLSKDPEAFGRVSLEALTLGKPVAGYNHGGVGEQLQAMLPEGAVPVGEWKSLIPLLQSWEKSPPTPAANVDFTLENMLTRTLSVYERTLR